VRFKSALLSLFGSNVLLTLANLARDVSVATMFGAAAKSDVFFLAISVPVFFAMAHGNASRSVAVPALGRAMAAGDEVFLSVARRLVLTNTAGIVAVAGILSIGALIAWSASGGAVHARASAVVPFLIAILPMYVMSTVVESAQGPLQVRGHFLVSGLLRLGLPLGIVAGALMSGGGSIYGTAVGGTLAALGVMGAAAYYLSKEKMLPRGATHPLPADIRRMTIDGYCALMLANLIAGANPIINQWMASPLGPGAISQVGYANRLIVGVAALVLSALGPLLLIEFSKSVGTGDSNAIRRTYNQFTMATFWLGTLATVAIWLSSDLAVYLLYQRGAFKADDTRVVNQLLDVFALQLPFYWAGISGGTLVMALSLNRFFLLQGVILVAVNIVGNFALTRVIGVVGLALTTAIVSFAGFTMLQIYLTRRGHVGLPRGQVLEAIGAGALLAICALAIRRFHLQVALDSTLGQIAAALTLLAVVATISMLRARVAFKDRTSSVQVTAAQ
jgi:putative peptidoglycan lipid II flippase